MGDFHLNLFGKLEQGLFCETFKENQVLEYLYVGLLQELSFQFLRQTFYQFSVRFELELFPHFVRLVYIIANGEFELLVYVVFLCQPPHDLQAFVFLDVL